MHATRVKEDFPRAVDQWQTEESMHAVRAKEDFLRAVDQSQTEGNIADYERMKTAISFNMLCFFSKESFSSWSITSALSIFILS